MRGQKRGVVTRGTQPTSQAAESRVAMEVRAARHRLFGNVALQHRACLLLRSDLQGGFGTRMGTAGLLLPYEPLDHSAPTASVKLMPGSRRFRL